MSSELTQEEVAVFEEPVARPAVEPRDFRQPRRLSPAQTEVMKRRVFGALAPIEDSLRPWLRQRYRLKLIDLGEIHARSALEGLHDPLLVASFLVGGQQGWAVWESRAAVGAVEIITGAETLDEEDLEARTLSVVECGLVRDFLKVVVQQCAATFDLTAEGFVVSQTEEELEASTVSSDKADPQRTFLHLSFHGPGGPSTLRLYLPGIQPARLVEAEEEEPALEVPAHLEPVGLDVEALLGCVEVPLSELLKLEPGDVLPLGVRTGTPLSIRIDGCPIASAQWGVHDGRLAIRLQDFGTRTQTDE